MSARPPIGARIIRGLRGVSRIVRGHLEYSHRAAETSAQDADLRAAVAYIEALSAWYELRERATQQAATSGPCVDCRDSDDPHPPPSHSGDELARLVEASGYAAPLHSYCDGYSWAHRPGSWEWSTYPAAAARERLAAMGWAYSTDPDAPWRVRWCAPKAARELPR